MIYEKLGENELTKARKESSEKLKKLISENKSKNKKIYKKS